MIEPLLHAIDCPDADAKGGTHKLAYAEWPNAAVERQMVCVHGLTRNGRDFDRLAQACMNGFSVYCPDMPGRGRSAWLADKSQYHYGLYANDMVHFMDTLGLKDIYWVGTSMGGLIGMVVAALHPGRIKKLVINDIGPFIPEAAIQRLGDYVGKQVAFDTMDQAEAYLRTILAPWGVTNPEHWAEMATHSFVERNGKLMLHYDPDIRQNFLSAKGDVDMWELWGHIKCPVLVLRGGKSDLLSAETADRMLQSGKHVELVEFPEIGHAPALMQPDQIQIVREWLLE